MVGFSDVSHCDTCGSCGAPLPYCQVLNMVDVDDVCVAGWTYFTGPNRWETNTDGAMNMSSVGHNLWNLILVLDVTWTGTGESATIRLIGGGVDCDNYWYFQLEMYDGVSGQSKIRVSIGQVIAGVDNERAIHPYSGYTFEGNELNGTDQVDLTFCYNGTYLYGFSSHPVGPSFSSPPALLFNEFDTGISVDGNLCGMLVKDFSNVSLIKVLQFTYNKVETICDKCLLNCCKGKPNPNITIEITDPTPNPGGLFCVVSDPCPAILGTIILDLENGQFISDARPGDGSCRYYKAISYGGFGTITVISQIIVNQTTGVIQFTVELIDLGCIPATPIAKFDAFTSLPCLDWDDWIDFNFDSNAPHYCQTDDGFYTNTMTARFKGS